MAETAGKRLYSINEALMVLPISRSLLYKLIQSGQLPTVRFGRRAFIRATTIERLLSEPEQS